MKRILLLFTLSIVSLSLFSSIYQSNELGQMLSLEDELSGVGYERENRDDGYTLYLDGNEVKKRTDYSDGWAIIEKDASERIFLDSDGNIERHVIKSGDREELYSYYYSKGRLRGLVHSTDGEIDKTIDYTFLGDRLSRIDGTESAIFLSDRYIWKTEDGVEEASVKAEEDSIFERNTDGRLMAISGDETTYFREDGSIDSKVSPEYKKNYSYREDGSLESVETIKGEERIIEEYDLFSSVIRTVFYNGDELKKIRTLLPSGDIEEIRYLSSRPMFRLVYDYDGARLKEMSAL